MSENTDREAFKKWYLKQYGCLAFRPSASQKELSDTRTMEFVWQAAIAHKKNESIATTAEALEKAAKLCDRYIAQEKIDGNPAPMQLLQDEIRALIKETP